MADVENNMEFPQNSNRKRESASIKKKRQKRASVIQYLWIPGWNQCSKDSGTKSQILFYSFICEIWKSRSPYRNGVDGSRLVHGSAAACNSAVSERHQYVSPGSSLLIQLGSNVPGKAADDHLTCLGPSNYTRPRNQTEFKDSCFILLQQRTL